MRVIRARNVNGAYAQGMELMNEIGEKQDSRAGEVLAAPHPVMTVYERPWERVLFNPWRDANPFFHLFEAIWMLSGSNDGRWLDRFVHDFSRRFAEDDGHLHGAYGHRWINHWVGSSQLDLIVARLRNNPEDRRAVITMWDPDKDLLDPESSAKRDIPCNTHVYPRIVDGALDITVCCRSNDIIWGAYGANAVHFSVLQEYLARRIGVKMGLMYQLSNNWHAYKDVVDRIVRRAGGIDLYPEDFYTTYHLPESPLFSIGKEIDRDIATFMSEGGSMYANAVFTQTLLPMWYAWDAFKAGNLERALSTARNIEAHDWQKACVEWLMRRRDRKRETEVRSA